MARFPSTHIHPLRCGLVVFLLWLALGVAAGSAHAQPIRITYLTVDATLPGILSAWRSILTERPDLRDRVTVTLLTESLLDDVDSETVLASDVLILNTLDQSTLERFDAEHAVDLVGRVAVRGLVLPVDEGLHSREHYVGLGAAWDERARAFWRHSGVANQIGLLKYVLSAAGIPGLTVPAPQPSLEAGYYHPEATTGEPGASAGQVFATWEAFDVWRQRADKLRPGAARVALGFYGASVHDGDTTLIDAVIAEIERQGAEAIPVFGYPAGEAFETLLRDADGAVRADVALAFLFRFAGPEASESLSALDIPVLNLIRLYGRSEAEWRASSQGLSLFEGTFQVFVPELAGLVAPTVVGSRERRTDPGTGLTVVVDRPLAARVRTAVRRAIAYALLASTPNAQKRVALLFYNYPPGKATIGASYLNVAESLSNILRQMRAAGYDLGGPGVDLSAAAVLKEMTARARNVGGYAPGELNALLDQGGAVRAWLGDYLRWLDGYTPAFRARVIADWGEPADVTVMASGGGFVIPAVRYGNVVVLPQPARGWGEDAEKLYHAKDLAPHHQYVATYSWLRAEEPVGFAADAVIHLGTHGTLEWLDGKDLGLSEDDAPDALIGDLPNLYVYNVDVVGEGLVARRRGMAALVDHMVPPFSPSKLLPALATLGESVNDYHNNVHKNVRLTEAYADQVRRQATDLGMVKDLGVDLGSGPEIPHESVHAIEDYLIELRGQNVPYGLHAFGRSPGPEMRETTVEAIVSVDRSLLPHDAAVLAADMDRRIVESGSRELAHLLRALDGGHVPVGAGGEPIRNPDVYPTGKNFYGIDPEKVPKPAAWRLGVDLAEQMLADHVAEHGRYPEKVSFVIWGDETLRHEGVLESQVFHLLGTRPVWDARGKVVDVEVVPTHQLGRPRVDIVIASSAAGMFSNVTRLMSEAVQRVTVLEEAENYVRRHYLATKAALIGRGYTEEDADRRAGVRIFDEPPGRFNLNTSRIAAASGTWDSDRPMADEYLSKLGHGYGNGFWGEPMEDVFRLALSGTEKVVHSSSTMVYGALDNDDFFMYMGGLAAAVRSIDGESPEMVVTNTRDPGRPEMTGIDEFIGAELRTRYINPTWIEGMQREGYAGAGEMRAFVEYLWGWDATVSDTVDDAMWQNAFAVYVEDRYDLGMKRFFDVHSPFAYQDMTGRMVETIRKGYWEADDTTTGRLLREYVESVATHGVGCSLHTCGNPRLLRYVLEQGAVMNIPGPTLEAYRAAVEEAIGTRIETAAAAAEEFVRRNEARPAPPTTINIEGYRMTATMEESTPSPAVPAISSEVADGWTPLWVGLPLLGLLAAWSRWRRRASERVAASTRVSSGPRHSRFLRSGRRFESLGCAMAVASALGTALPHPAVADSLEGRILDPQDRVVPSAQIRLFDRASGQVRETVSSPDGSYLFDAIPPGDYVLDAQGSAGALSGATVVRVDGSSLRDLALAVSSVTTEVVVTASSTPLTVQETAKALDVIDAEEIVLRNEMSVAEAVRTLPGIRVQSLGGPGSFTTIQTRGMRSYDTAVLIDGMRFRDAASPQGDATSFLAHLATVDTEQIEVMRGSGSSLYGSNAMAGVINITSRTGGGPAQGDVLAEGGGLGMFRAVPSIRGGLAGDRLTYSGAVSYLDVTEGVRGANPHHSVSPQGMVRYQFTPAVSATGRLWYTVDAVRLRNNPEFPAAVVANFPSTGIVPAVVLPTDQLELFEQGLPFIGGSATFVPSANDPDSNRNSSFLNGSAMVRHTVAPGATYRVSYQGVDTNREFINGPRGAGFQPSTENSSHFDGRTDTVQARLDSALGTTNFFSAGYEFEREQYYREASADAATVTIDSYSHALYAQDRIELLDSRLQLSFGGRVQTFSLPDPVFVGGSHPYGDANFEVPTAYTGDVALAYFLPDSGTKLRVHVGNSYRAPSAFERFGGSFSSFSSSFSFWGDPRLRPERSAAFDGGIDQWLFDSKLQLSATVFYTELQESIIVDFATFPAATDPFSRFGGYRNTGGGRARGVETSAQAAPSISTNLRVSYTYTDAESDTPTVGDDFFGVLGLSKHLFTLTATQWIAQRASVTFDLFVASDYSLSPFGALGRHLLFSGPVKGDLVVRYDLLARRDLGLDLYAKVENLFDNLYYEDGFLTPGAWAIGGMRIRY